MWVGSSGHALGVIFWEIEEAAAADAAVDLFPGVDGKLDAENAAGGHVAYFHPRKLFRQIRQIGIVTDEHEAGDAVVDLVEPVNDGNGATEVDDLVGSDALPVVVQRLGEATGRLKGARRRTGENQLDLDLPISEYLSHEGGIPLPALVQGAIEVDEIVMLPTRFGVAREIEDFHGKVNLGNNCRLSGKAGRSSEDSSYRVFLF